MELTGLDQLAQGVRSCWFGDRDRDAVAGDLDPLAPLNSREDVSGLLAEITNWHLARRRSFYIGTTWPGHRRTVAVSPPDADHATAAANSAKRSPDNG